MFETPCGSLTQYGMKHMRAFATAVFLKGPWKRLVWQHVVAMMQGYYIHQTKVTVLDDVNTCQYWFLLLV